MNTTSVGALSRVPWWAFGLGLAVLLAAVFLLRTGAKAKDVGSTFIVRRGPLEISVLEGGNVESEEKGEVKCEVKGGQGVKILKIVPEGYQVTEEDVKTNKVLVEFDSSELRKQITQQEITFGSTAASLTDAQQAFEIQVNQNLSDTMAAQQKAQFARMDFDKYMGDQAAGEILAQLGVRRDLETEPPPVTNSLALALPGLPGSASGTYHAAAADPALAAASGSTAPSPGPTPASASLAAASPPAAGLLPLRQERGPRRRGGEAETPRAQGHRPDGQERAATGAIHARGHAPALRAEFCEQDGT